MATYWVRADGSGVDSPAPGNGTAYGNAWATISYALTQLNTIGVKGDILNLANDGVHDIDIHAQINGATMTGTSFSDPGLTIQGVTTTGTPVFTSCACDAVGGARMLDLRNGARYFILRGLKMDFTLSPGGTDVVRYTGATSGPALIEACHVKGYADNAIGNLQRDVMGGLTTGPPDYGIVRYSYIENCPDAMSAALGSTTKKIDWNYVVFSYTGDWSPPAGGFLGTLQAGTGPVNASDAVGFTQNTVYVNENGTTAMSSIFDWGPAAGDAGTVNLHSNYGWIETNGTIAQVFGGSPGSTATFAGTVGFNTIRFGPSVVAGDNAGGLYEAPYDGGTDPKLTDDVAYTTASSALFNAVGSPWTWEDVNGTGYDIPLPRDLRPLLRLTSSSTGGIPGALPAVGTDLAIDIVADTLTPLAMDPLTLTITLTNTGMDATGIVCAAAIPTGLSYETHAVTVGSYDAGTGVWTVGSLNDGATAILEITVHAQIGTGGLTIIVPVSITSFTTPLEDTEPLNDTDSVTLVIGKISKTTNPFTGNEKILPPVTSTDEKILPDPAVFVEKAIVFMAESEDFSPGTEDGDVLRTETTLDTVPSEI